MRPEATYAETIPDFQSELADIIDRPLSADTIDTYAESALDDLGDFIQSVVDSYRRSPVLGFADDRELEDAAFDYFGLDRIEETLDHIGAKALEIRALDTTIASAEVIDKVILPPVPTGRQEANGTGPKFERRKKIPRLKTLLFILANDFGVDVNDREELRITRGAVEGDMLRRESYYLIKVPRLGKTVLVCDESENATFVFNDKALEKSGIDTDKLLDLHKGELHALLESEPGAGQRVVYSENFVSDSIEALADSAAALPYEGNAAEVRGRYLIPKPPEGVLALAGVCKAIGVKGRTVVEKAVEDLGDALGETRLYMFAGQSVRGYTPDQQELIREHLEKSGYYSDAPEGFLNANDLSKVWGVHNSSVGRVIKDLAEELGQVQSYKSGSNRTPYYSPDQQQRIHSLLEAKGVFAELAPKGFLSVRGIADQYGIDFYSAASVIEEIGESLGETRVYKFGPKAAPGYSPEQQEEIRRQLEQRGLFTSAPPEGVLSLKSMGASKQFGIGENALRRVITELGDELGEVKMYRFGSRISPGFGPRQQKVIEEYLERRGSSAPPEGFLAAPALIKIIGGREVVYGAIRRLGDELGPVENYQSHNGPAPYYSPRQQKIIEEHIRAIRAKRG